MIFRGFFFWVWSWKASVRGALSCDAPAERLRVELEHPASGKTQAILRLAAA